LRDIEQHVASATPRTPRAQGQDPVVAQVQEMLRSCLELRPIPLHILDPLPHPLVALVGRSLKHGVDRNPLDIRVNQRIKVASPLRERPVELLEEPLGDLHVLLRHRPLSIPLTAPQGTIVPRSESGSTSEAPKH
jgi:hypothetical protein